MPLGRRPDRSANSSVFFKLSPNAVSSRISSDRIILALACVAQFMVILDVSVVNVALPSIGRDLHYSATGLQWVVNAYVLTFAGFLLLGGRAADLFGRRRVYLFGLVLFSAASLVGGFAQTSGWLTAARAVQGIGGAVLSPATLTIIVTTFSGQRLAKALGVVERHGRSGRGGRCRPRRRADRRAELALGAVHQRAHRRRHRGRGHRLLERGPATRRRTQRLDVAGAITVTAGLAVLVYAIVGHRPVSVGLDPHPGHPGGRPWPCWPCSWSSRCGSPRHRWSRCGCSGCAR